MRLLFSLTVAFWILAVVAFWILALVGFGMFLASHPFDKLV